MKISYSDIGVFLEPGQLYISREAVLVKTILGSCVAVCLHDPKRKIGGINHYLLPYPGKDATKADGRYGATSVERLMAEIQRAGALRGNLKAYVVGGGRPVGGEKGPQVGAANRELAVEMLMRYGIPILREETGGEFGRRVFFNTGTGDITISIIQPNCIEKAGANRRTRP